MGYDSTEPTTRPPSGPVGYSDDREPTRVRDVLDLALTA
jgi:hypothetical protein